MKRIWSLICRAHDAVEGWLNWGAGIVIIGLGLMTVIQVGMRATYKAPSGVIEISELMLVAIIFFAIAYTQTVRGHVRLELFIDMVRGRKRHLIEALYLVVFLVVFGIITVQSGKSAWIALKVGDVHGDILKVPVWPAKAAVALGSGFLSLRFLRQMIGHLVALLVPVAPSEVEKARLDYE